MGIKTIAYECNSYTSNVRACVIVVFTAEGCGQKHEKPALSDLKPKHALVCESVLKEVSGLRVLLPGGGGKKSLNNWNEHERDCRVMVLTKVVSIRGNPDCYDVTQAVTWKICFCFWTFFRVNNRSLGKLIKSARSLITELQVQKIHITFSIQSCLTTSGMVKKSSDWSCLLIVFPFASQVLIHLTWVEWKLVAAEALRIWMFLAQ